METEKKKLVKSSKVQIQKKVDSEFVDADGKGRSTSKLHHGETLVSGRNIPQAKDQDTEGPTDRWGLPRVS